MLSIHIVQPRETIASISQLYNIPIDRLMRDNNLLPNQTLNIGRTIMIAYPEQTYIVQPEDTLQSIVEAFGISLRQLLRNNPFIADRDPYYLMEGEELTIRYYNDKSIKVNGFTFTHISEQILRKTLPYLTFLTILNYRVTAEGDLIDINDTELILLAKEYNVASYMFVSTLDMQGGGSYEITHNLLINMDAQINFIENVLIRLRAKGYYGLTLGFQYILREDYPLYIEFAAFVTNRLNNEGFVVDLTLIPPNLGYQLNIPYVDPYIEAIGKSVNHIKLISYLWPTSSMSTVYETTYGVLKQHLDFAVTQIPPEKIYLGLSRIAYDWELPYEEGFSRGVALTNAGAISLADQLDVVIQYDEVSRIPYFHYNIYDTEHLVWYRDARSINSVVNLVMDYGLQGISIWNIMYYHTQTWLIINSQYDIETVI